MITSTYKLRRICFFYFAIYPNNARWIFLDIRVIGRAHQQVQQVFFLIKQTIKVGLTCKRLQQWWIAQWNYSSCDLNRCPRRASHHDWESPEQLWAIYCTNAPISSHDYRGYGQRSKENKMLMPFIISFTWVRNQLQQLSFTPKNSICTFLSKWTSERNTCYGRN